MPRARVLMTNNGCTALRKIPQINNLHTFTANLKKISNRFDLWSISLLWNFWNFTIEDADNRWTMCAKLCEFRTQNCSRLFVIANECSYLLIAWKVALQCDWQIFLLSYQYQQIKSINKEMIIPSSSEKSIWMFVNTNSNAISSWASSYRRDKDFRVLYW